MMGIFMILFPLQVSVTDFSWSSKPKTSPKDIIIVFVIIAVIVAALFIINARKGSTTGKKGSSGAGAGSAKGGIFSVFALHRIARNLGLDHEQTKMLDYVFKTDQVIDPQRSINTPSLLDRHFRRAYRVIEQTHGHENETQHKLAVLFSTRNIIENSVLEGLTSTRQIKDDTKFSIVANKDKIDVHVISTKGDNIDVESPKNVLGSQIKIQRGTKLTVLFFDKSNKGFSFETRVTGYSTRQGHPTMQMAHSNQLRFLSQRRFRRKQASVSSSMYLVIVEGSGKKQRLIADKRKLQGNIADISVGGCSIKTMTPIQVGARFKIEFLLCDVNLAALGQVLRTNRTGANTIIHIKFLKLSQKSMNVINSFVYEYSQE
jgi:c-di-GMP-binding flagellar brake protein YcgR